METDLDIEALLEEPFKKTEVAPIFSNSTNSTNSKEPVTPESNQIQDGGSSRVSPIDNYSFINQDTHDSLISANRKSKESTLGDSKSSPRSLSPHHDNNPDTHRPRSPSREKDSLGNSKRRRRSESFESENKGNLKSHKPMSRDPRERSRDGVNPREISIVGASVRSNPNPKESLLPRERSRERSRDVPRERSRERRSRDRSIDRSRERVGQGYKEKSREDRYRRQDRHRPRHRSRSRSRPRRYSRSRERYNPSRPISRRHSRERERVEARIIEKQTDSSSLAMRSRSPTDIDDRYPLKRPSKKEDYSEFGPLVASSSSSARQAQQGNTLSPEEKDKRTIFVKQLAQRLREYELKEFFSRAGAIRQVKIVMDKYSRRSKGVGYVEFYDVESVDMAMSMDGKNLMGIPVIVERINTEKNRLAEIAMTIQKQRAVQHKFTRVEVGNLAPSVTDEILFKLFEPYGSLEFAYVQRDPESKRSKGFAYVQFRKPTDAKTAMDDMQDHELLKRKLKISIAADQTSHLTRFSLETEKSRLMAKLARGEDLSFSKSNATATSTTVHLNDSADGNGNGNPTLVSHSNDVLSSSSITSLPSTPLPNITVNDVESTTCVLLTNMFDPSTETGQDWDKEIELDVKDECTKFGNILYISVDKDSMGHVYLMFENVKGAQEAIKALHGRFFAGKQVVATFIAQDVFKNSFSRALS